MSRNSLYALKTKSQSHSNGAGERHRRNRRSFGLERLEDRMMLSGGPTVFTVTDTSDLITDTGSLVFAIKQANANPNPAGSLIEFSTPLFSTPQTITLTSTLTLTGSAGPITIAGPGANLLTVSGGNAVEVFDVDFGTTAVLSGLTISGGSTTRDGGGVFNDGTLTLLNSTVTANTVTGDGGEGGGVYNEGVMTISGCTITNNTVSGGGGGGEGGGVINFEVMTITGSTITNNTVSGPDGRGGGVFTEGAMTISGSTFANNAVSGMSGEGGGVWNEELMTISGSTITSNEVSGSDGEGGGVFTDGEMTLANSTVENNSASGSGGEAGGIFNEDLLVINASAIAMNSAANVGGGIWTDYLLTISDSTVAGNSAGSQGGGIFTEDVLTAVNTTIADNSVLAAGAGGGLFVYTGSLATLDNTIVALNAAGAVPDDVHGTGTLSATSSFNLIGTGGSGGLTNAVNGNQVGVASPGLGPLASNAGPTATIALLPGSPAIDAGSNALDGLATDQRGPGLVRIFNGTIDIGAFELQPATVTAVSVDWGSAGTAALQTAADGLRLLPAGRNTDLPWSGINRLQINFNQPETLTAAEVTVMSARGVNYGPVTITGSGETFTITLSQPISKADRVTIVIASAGIASFTRRLDVLPGDLDDNGAVNKADLKSVRNELMGVTAATVFGRVVGDQTVDGNDVKAVKKSEGKKLPKIRNIPLVALDRALARARHTMRQLHHH
jgi:hypothetical protein